MGSVGDIWVNIGLKSTIDRDSAKAKGAMAKLSGTVKQHGVMIGGAMTGMGAAMLMAGNKVDKAYASIISGTGATGKALEDLKGSFHDVYGTIPADAQTVGDALATLNTLTGATGDTLEDLTVNIAEVSRMMGEDAAGNAESFGQAMKQWQIPAEEGTELMDKIYKICQDTNIGFGSLTTSLNKYGAVMQNAGYSVEETASFMGKLHAGGIQVSRIMPGLNAAFRNWAKEGKDARTMLNNTITAISEASTEMEALTIATDAFGAEGAQRLVTAVRTDMIGSLDDLTTGLEDTEGLIADTAAETLTLSDRLATLKNRFTELLAPLQPVGAVMTVLGPSLMAVSAAMNLTSIGAGTGTIAYTQYAIAELGVAGATKALTLALLSNPLFLGVAIGAGVIAGLYLLERKFGILTKASEDLSIAFKNVGKGLKIIGKELVEAGQKGKATLDILIARTDTWLMKLTGVDQATINHTKHTAVWLTQISAQSKELTLLQLGYKGLTTTIDSSKTSFDGLINTLGDLGDNSEETMARIKTAMGTISPAIAEYEDAVKDAEDAQDDLSEAVERTADLKTEVDGLTSAYGDLKSAVDLILGVEEDLDDQTRSITRAQLTLNDAEKESKAILDGVLEGSKEAVEAEVDRADARERHAKILADEESTTAEIAKANYDLADAEKTYEGVMHGVAADSKEAVKATLDLEDARDSLEDKTAKLIDTIEDAGTTDEQITRILKDNNIELSQSLKARLATAKFDLKKSTDNTIANLGIEKKAHESAYEGIITEVNGILREKTTAYERALSTELKLSEDYKTKQAEVDKLKADTAIVEWDRVVKAIKANPAEAEIHIKKYMDEHDIAIPEETTPTTPKDWETGSPFWESGLEGVDYNPPPATDEEGPRHKQWVSDKASTERALTNAGRYLSVAIGNSNAKDIGIYTDSVARLQKELDNLNANKPAFTAHEGGIIPATGIYRIEMEKGEKIIPLSKQEPVEQRTSIAVNVMATIHNYSDIERLEYQIGEAVARGMHNKVGLR